MESNSNLCELYRWTAYIHSTLIDHLFVIRSLNETLTHLIKSFVLHFWQVITCTSGLHKPQYFSCKERLIFVFKNCCEQHFTTSKALNLWHIHIQSNTDYATKSRHNFFFQVKELWLLWHTISWNTSSHGLARHYLQLRWYVHIFK